MNERLVQQWEDSVAVFDQIPLNFMIGDAGKRRLFDESLAFSGVYAWVWGNRDNIVYIGKTGKPVAQRMREHLLGLLSPAYVIGEEVSIAESPWTFNLKDEGTLAVLRSEAHFLELMQRKYRYFNQLSVVAAPVDVAAQGELEGALIREHLPMHNATHGMRSKQGGARESAILRLMERRLND